MKIVSKSTSVTHYFSVRWFLARRDPFCDLGEREPSQWVGQDFVRQAFLLLCRPHNLADDSAGLTPFLVLVP